MADMTRIKRWYNDLKKELTTNEIIAGLENGEIKVPDWMAMSEGIGELKIWDFENGGSHEMGFLWLEVIDEQNQD